MARAAGRRVKRPASRARYGGFQVVAVGASAGGLEALTRLFGRLRPDSGMAYVVILHLSPDFKSELVSILQRSTSMPVVAASQGALVEPDTVYVIPPDTGMTIARGRLELRARSTPAMPVDLFMRSLADERGAAAIAVVLSGSAHDGTMGVQAVKGAGGITFAQDDSARQSGMPLSAVGTGAVDFQLPPEGIADELQRIARRPPTPAARHGQQTMRKIFGIVRDVTGVDFERYKQSTVARRLARRLVVHRLATAEDYLDLLRREPAEARAFCEEALIHVTHFFREPKAFDILKKRALPRLLRGARRSEPIRVWVPGCSTGKEAYSLAICLLDAMGRGANARPLQVFATDVSDEVVNRARAGAYPEGIRQDVPADLLRRYFTKTETGYQVSKAVRDSCVFAKQNLAKDPPFANLDLISCRNVLIYFEAGLQRTIFPIFHYALKPTGALMLGAAEGLGEFSPLFTSADPKAHVYFKKPGASKAKLDIHAVEPARTASMPEPKPRPQPTAGWPESDVQKAVERLLLSRFAPAGVIVDSSLEILHFQGPVSRYFKPAPGKASLNLLKMVPTECHAPLRSLVQKAQRSQAAAVRKGLSVELASGEIETITLEAIPVRGPLSGEQCLLVLFETEPEKSSGSARADAKPPGGNRLRKELASTKEYLQAVIEDHEAANEELKAANEEIVSSNEELQSTNEELETAKEELQAANEELTTLNEELQTRNADLSVSNNDLVNLLASVHLPIVMLGSDLRIRRFTPLAEKIMNLIPGDMGRAIGDIKPKIDVPDLEQIVVGVIESVATREVEVRDREGRWYSLRVRPYKTTENKIDGAVLVLIDIDAVKKAALDLKQKTVFAEAMFDMVREGLAVLNADLTVRSGNRAFLRMCEPSTSVFGRSLFEVAGGRWDAPPLRKKLERLVKSSQNFVDLKAEIGGAPARLSARRIADEAGKPTLLLSIDASAR